MSTVDRPILFSAPMVRALLAGTKTQTRRAIKAPASVIGFRHFDADRWDRLIDGNVRGDGMRCPYGQPGDRLWVRETWQYFDWTEGGEPIIRYAADEATRLPLFAPDLSDVWAALSDPENYAVHGRACDQRWRPSIHIPRWASRITLEVTGVRVERLQDISAADCISEGVGFDVRYGGYCVGDGMHFHVSDPCQSYFSLWEAINGPGSVEANPFLWVVEFPAATSVSACAQQTVRPDETPDDTTPAAQPAGRTGEHE